MSKIDEEASGEKKLATNVSTYFWVHDSKWKLNTSRIVINVALLPYVCRLPTRIGRYTVRYVRIIRTENVMSELGEEDS